MKSATSARAMRKRSWGKRVRQDTVFAGERVIGKARRPDNGVIDLTRGEHPLLRLLIGEGMSQQCRLAHPENHVRKSILIFAVIGFSPGGAEHNQTRDT